jgi:hypothetical protein
MSATSLYSEETFGILTDDDIYLDCVLVKSPDLSDEQLQLLRVWVPKYPLTKTSVITCARREIIGYGRNGRLAHLAFDLRGTGESEGVPGDRNFQLDMQAIKAWADERFGAINFGFLGLPEDRGRVKVLPIRPGVVMEASYYKAATIAEGETRPPIVYLATYGNFGRIDDALCLSLAQAGYEVYGIDPLRYLLHAGNSQRLTPAELWQDCQVACAIIGERPLLIAQPISAGLAMFWAAGVKEISGVLAIGKTDGAFRGAHIFDSSNAYNFFLGRHVYHIAPRPVLIVQQEGHPLGGNADEQAALFETCGHPRRLVRTREINPTFLLTMLDWLQNPVEEGE